MAGRYRLYSEEVTTGVDTIIGTTQRPFKKIEEEEKQTEDLVPVKFTHSNTVK